MGYVQEKEVESYIGKNKMFFWKFLGEDYLMCFERHNKSWNPKFFWLVTQKFDGILNLIMNKIHEIDDVNKFSVQHTYDAIELSQMINN